MFRAGFSMTTSAQVFDGCPQGDGLDKTSIVGQSESMHETVRSCPDRDFRRTDISISFTPFYMAQSTEPHVAQSSTKPVKTFRLRGVSVSVFKNHGKSENRDVSFHKVSVQRSYRDGDEWKTTTSFSRDDLPITRLLLDRAWQYILDAEVGRGRNADDE